MKKLTFSIFFLTLLTSTMIFFSSCSNKMPQETLPSTVETSESSAVSEETTTEGSMPLSSARVNGKLTGKYGRISVNKGFFVDKNGEKIAVCGLFCDYEGMPDSFYNKDTFQTFAEDWGCGMMEIPVFYDHNGEGFINEDDGYLNRICEYINLCTESGMYAVVYIDGTVPADSAGAVDFFKRLSAIYNGNEAVLYEIAYNDNEGYKSYRDRMINAIRENDLDSLIICELKDLTSVSENALSGDNIAYSAGFVDSDEFPGILNSVMVSGYPVIVTYNDDIPTSLRECWIYRNTKALFNPDTELEKLLFGHWSDDMLYKGTIIRNIMLIGL